MVVQLYFFLNLGQTTEEKNIFFNRNQQFFIYLEDIYEYIFYFKIFCNIHYSFLIFDTYRVYIFENSVVEIESGKIIIVYHFFFHFLTCLN